MKILITGGCGFIGCNLIRLLNAGRDVEITVLDNESVGRAQDLEGLRVARFVQGDVRDSDAVDRAMAGQDAVVHLAAQTGVMPSIADPLKDCEVNVLGGITLLEACRRHGAKRFINASSSAPVGATPPPMREDLPPRPASPYGASKLAVEGYCSAYYHSFGIDTASLRFSNCYGSGSRNKSSVVALFIKTVLAGEPVVVYGDGEQTRDFIAVEDLCRAILLTLTHPGGPGIFGETYQVATGVETTINQLISLLDPLVRRDLGRPMEVRYLPARAGEVVRNYSDISKFVTVFGFRPQIELTEGLNATWSYFLGQEKGGKKPPEEVA